MPYSKAANLIYHVSLRQLQIFEAVIRLGGYTKAAEALHLTQPTVSMQVKKLSQTIGTPLLEQIGRHVQPTTAGRDVYSTSQKVLGNMVELGDTISESDGIIKGELHIAAITSAKYFIPQLLAAFIEQHPDVKPRLTVANRDGAIKSLLSNADDLLIMGHIPPNLAVEAYPVLDNELVVVAPPDHPLCGEKNIPLERLTQEKFLEREMGSGTRMAMEKLFAENGFRIEPHMELGSSEAIKQAVMAKLGLSVLSRRNLRLELAGGHIAVLDVEGFPLKRKWYAVHLRGKKLSLLTSTFLEFLLNSKI